MQQRCLTAIRWRAKVRHIKPSMALFASTIGGLLSAFALLFLAPQIAKITLLFGPAEYLALVVFGLSVISGVSNKNIFKGLIGACIGIFMSTIGMDNISGTTRFTFGNINLMSGIDLIIALIGLFAISEIMMKSQYNPKRDHKQVSAASITKDKITKEEYKRCRKPILLGIVLGPLAENNFRRAMLLSDGSLSIFVTRPISLLFLVIAVVSVSVFAWKNHKAKVAEKLAKQKNA